MNIAGSERPNDPPWHQHVEVCLLPTLENRYCPNSQLAHHIDNNRRSRTCALVYTSRFPGLRTDEVDGRLGK
jgi:hypothetical protein